MPTNYIISIHGRGATYAFLAAADTDENMAERCQPAVNSGFEVFIYTLEASLLGQVPFAPTASTHLRRVYHLYDAHEEYRDKAKDIIEGLCAHSEAASKEYLGETIQILAEEYNKLVKTQAERNQLEGTNAPEL